MHRNRLLNLIRANARKGEFRAEANTIFLYDVIVSSKADAEWLGGVDAETFVQTLSAMEGDVSIRVNSPGGDVFAARAMAQAMREHPGKVTVHVDGYAASAATFVTAAADAVVMSPGSMLMIHKAWSIEMGNADDFSATASLLDKIDQTIAETYQAQAAKRGKDATTSEFVALMAAETWFTGQEAIDAGLADAVDDQAPKAKARWDFSAYEHPPEADPASTDEITIEADDANLGIVINAPGATAETVEQVRAELALKAAVMAGDVEAERAARIRAHQARLLNTGPGLAA